MIYPPAGYDVDELDRIVMSSDEAVRNAIGTVFVKLAELGSARRVCTWWKEQGLKSLCVVSGCVVSRLCGWICLPHVSHGCASSDLRRRVRIWTKQAVATLDRRTLQNYWCGAGVPRDDWAVLLTIIDDRDIGAGRSMNRMNSSPTATAR